MRTNKSILFLMLGTMGLWTSCVSEERDLDLPQKPQKETGTLLLSLNAEAAFDANTRALNEASYRNTSNYTVQILNSSQSVLLECKGSELNDNLPKELEIGSYVVKAFYGTESAASRNDFRVEGNKALTIEADQTTSVNVDCTPTCGKISVAFDSDMAIYYDNYSVTFGGTTALGSNTIAWAMADTEPWYVALGTSAETVTYTVSLTAKEAYAIVDASGQKQTTGTATGTFQLERNKAQKLTVKPNYVAPTEGGVTITITIDDSTNDRPVTIEVPVSWI